MKWTADYHRLGERIVTWSGQTDKFVHVHTGLLIWLAAAIVLKRKLSSWTPFAVAAAAEAANEVMDWLFFGRKHWGDTIGDVVATLAWPLVLTVALQRFRQIRG